MVSKKNYKTLRFVFGDQLNPHHSWYDQVDGDVVYVIAEMHHELTYVKHHIQKVCAFFAAMEAFASSLHKRGLSVIHLTLDDTKQFDNLDHLVTHLAGQYGVQKVEFQQPDEYRLLSLIKGLELPKRVELNIVSSEHFILSLEELPKYFKKDHSHQMEAFYRIMRKRFNILMEGDKPAGGEWNYDRENRHKLSKKDVQDIPPPRLFKNPVKIYLERLKRHKVEYIGNPTDPLVWPINVEQAECLLEYFCEHLLPNFGQFQDAMTCDSPNQWSLYHSRLSFCLNIKLLHPMRVINRIQEVYSQNKTRIGLAQVEGYIRQILGWREFVRGIYWVNMPNYQTLNYFQAKTPLPNYFWNAKTNMNCVRAAISQSLDYAYAHHIQRLMITGNLCLLAGVDPDEVDQWYLGIYVDAIQWVELPNTRGMSQYADAGLMATKPYAASANYIHKMSDYCAQCKYTHSQKIGDKACPFNSLYWHFLDRNRSKLAKNPRLRMAYKNWDNQGSEQKNKIKKQAQWYIEHLDNL